MGGGRRVPQTRSGCRRADTQLLRIPPRVLRPGSATQRACLYTFIDLQGGLVTRAERLANIASGAPNVVEGVNEREIMVRVAA